MKPDKCDDSQHEHWPTETIFIYLQGVYFIQCLEGGHLINQNLSLFGGDEGVAEL